ncbi:unnamed protein product, partial [Prorocentrum cordatum]
EIVRQVLCDAASLQAGRRIVIQGSKFLSGGATSEDASAGTDSARGILGPLPLDQQRTMMNRALRHMSRILPGCAWTLDNQGLDAQVHLADMAQFKAFCKERKWR